MKRLIGLFLIILLAFNYTSFANTITKENNNRKNAYIYEKQDFFFKDFGNTYVVMPSLFFNDFIVYNEPNNFYIASFVNKKLVFLYTSSKNFAGIKNVMIGTLSCYAKSVFNNKIIKRYIIKNDYVTTFISDDNLGIDYDCIDMNFYYIFLFYDNIKKPNYVSGILIVEKKLWNNYLIRGDKIKNFSKFKCEESFAKINLMHINSLRNSLKLKMLSSSSQLNLVAFKHSFNMSKLNFFSHIDLDGLSPFDRMTNEGIKFISAGENIAHGDKLLPIFANHLLFNSPGHRKNIEGNFDYLGVGVSIRPNDLNIYYTQNFIK